jgi:cobyrinic acid a,c-diamide synthase
VGGIVIAGDRSGAGKTTVTLALLAALRSRQATVQAFKVGPDYIDPMFHRELTGRPAYNLDPVLTSEKHVQQCFQTHSATVSYAIVEGVMGLFDGAGGTEFGSTAHVARLINCPVVLVIDTAKLSRSLAAILYGFATLDDRIIVAGVVLNRVGSDRHLAMLQAAIAPLGIPVLGVLRRDDAVTLPDRYLGLIPTDELTDLPARFRYLAALGHRCFDWTQWERLFRLQPVVSHEVSDMPLCPIDSPIRIGFARDRAFNFYYEENLQQLHALGAELVPFSPLTDTALPEAIQGLWLGGGFPEQFAAALSANVPLRQAIAAAVKAGLSTYAECGGLMYLGQQLTDFHGQTWEMVGALPISTTMTNKLTLGYRHATAERASPLVEPGQQIWGHEFHRSTPVTPPQDALYRLTTYPLPGEVATTLPGEGWASNYLHASYVHLHWGDRPTLPERFLQHCNRPIFLPEH